MGRYGRGAIAGIVATAAHTAAMLFMREVLPRARREPVPPVQLTERSAMRAGAYGVRREPLRKTVAALLHIGYGAATGALYGPIGARAVRRPVVTGIVFGCGIWAGSYLGWIPASGLLRPATREPAARNAMMLAAHVAWGAALGATFAELRAHASGAAPVMPRTPDADGATPNGASGSGRAR